MIVTMDIWLLGGFAFCGGLIDAAVGGGGLVLIPALFHTFPGVAASTLLGTNKFAVLLGTGASAYAYFRRVSLQWGLLLPALCCVFLCAYVGAMSTTKIANDDMKYVVFVLLIAMALYTFFRKELGQTQAHKKMGTLQRLQACLIGGAIGFYDGVFGPGSGSFFIFMFVRVFGFDFLNAAASAKILNMGAFLAALSFFVPTGHIIWQVGFYIAACNVLGAIVGTYVALRFGSQLIRKLFLGLLVFSIGRMGLSLL